MYVSGYIWTSTCVSPIRHHLLLTACGTSRHAAEFGAKIMRDLDCFETVAVMDSAEVRLARVSSVFELHYKLKWLAND